jgi:hypothetical protein
VTGIDVDGGDDPLAGDDFADRHATVSVLFYVLCRDDPEQLDRFAERCVLDCLAGSDHASRIGDKFVTSPSRSVADDQLISGFPRSS